MISTNRPAFNYGLDNWRKARNYNLGEMYTCINSDFKGKFSKFQINLIRKFIDKAGF